MTLTSTLDSRYDAPLTIIVPAPDAKSAKAVRKDDGKEFPVKLAKGSILLDMPPDGKPVDLTWCPSANNLPACHRNASPVGIIGDIDEDLRRRPETKIWEAQDQAA